MLSVLPHEREGTGDPPVVPRVDLDEAALLKVTDLWQRSKLADELGSQLFRLARIAWRVRAQAVWLLINQHNAKPHQIARHLKKSRQLVSQVARRRATESDSKAVA